MLTETEKSLSEQRTNAIDFARLPELHYLGNYVRNLPISLERMMENAYDWEHLPHIHASSFSSIELISGGPWGWRAKIGLPGGANGDYQLIDLLVEQAKHYWVSTVYSGPGAGVEIHTQATAISEHEIEVDVRFYFPEPPENDDAAKMILGYLQQQYKTLYDEDLALMRGRQTALDDRIRWAAGDVRASDVKVGALAGLDPDKVYTFDVGNGRFCVRYWEGRWHAHSAVCTHLLGPLDDAILTKNGEITCPWHGYRFDIVTGENCEEKCRALEAAPQLIDIDGTLYLRRSD